MVKEIPYSFSFRPLRHIGAFVSKKGSRKISVWLDWRYLRPLTGPRFVPFNPIRTGNEIRIGA